MAKDTTGAAAKTLELPNLEPAKRGRGRPKTGQAKTVSQRQAEFRQRKLEAYRQSVADFPKWLEAVYQAGFDDALNGRPPAPVETWRDPNAAFTYLNGGFDGEAARHKIK